MPTSNIYSPTPARDRADAKAQRSQGAELLDNGVRYRTWCEHDNVAALIFDHAGQILRAVEMQPCGDGYFEALDSLGRAEDLYRFRLNEMGDFPDPASRYQPSGVHGASMVVDPDAFEWSDHAWSCPALGELAIYELHIGTFTPAGTFRAAIEKLRYLRDLGITAIQLMPIADFPGDRNWGYDGVMPYAPARSYGNPDDLRALVDAAHAHGLAVILDVVYNHLGPDGNYVGSYHRGYFDQCHQTPWGAAFDFARPAVRNFFVENAPYWMREFHVDGFRVDATHVMIDRSHRHVLEEIAERVHELGGFVIAEDERNDPNLLLPPERGGLGFDACWADDFHHVLRVMLTGERDGYYRNFHGAPTELAQTLEHGWLFRGQRQATDGRPRGGDTSALAPEQFIYCISNHDQTGNRAFGERFGHVADPAAYRAASALLCLAPHTPMLFMGQEWTASTPFQFFTDHNDDLGQRITQGRRHEFRHFAAFADPAALEKIPDPQARDTFVNSKLRWEELEEPEHAGVLQLYRACLELRGTVPVFRKRSRGDWNVHELENGIVAIVLGLHDPARCLIIIDLIGGHEMPQIDKEFLQPLARNRWELILSSDETRFGGTDSAPFVVPATLVFQSVPIAG